MALVESGSAFVIVYVLPVESTSVRCGRFSQEANYVLTAWL